MLENIDTTFLDKNESYIVALSGGADSVALLRSLLELGYSVEACHCNFHLRGEESNRDEQFCKDLCKKLNIPLHIAHFDTKAYAHERGVSIEMAARDLRYAYFHKLITQHPTPNAQHPSAVCVAHHRDDQVETVLLNLIRGTGIEGLKGMTPKNGEAIRPLLNVTRREILDYLNSKGQDYVMDSSNLEDDVQRNVIRHKLVPQLLGINPQAGASIARTAQYVAEALAILNNSINEAHLRILSEDGSTLKIEALLKEQSPKTILWYWLKDKDFSSLQVEQIFDNLRGQSGRQWQSKSHRLLLDRGTLKVESGLLQTGKMQLRAERLEVDGKYQLSRDSETADLDADKVKEPLTLRIVHQGDWFIPLGMNGRKLVSDFLTDRKVSLFDKQRQMVVEDAEGRIVWLVNQRPDNRFAVTKATLHVLRLQISPCTVSQP